MSNTKRASRSADARPAGQSSLMTPLGVVAGEILVYLEEHGATPLKRVVRELEGPAALVTMAVGFLIREGLVRGLQHGFEVVLEPLAKAYQAG